jgi:outer membrane protein OmpA-like peptidoglycan-associated protein
LELVTSLNNIMFHKMSSNYNVYVSVGYSPIIYNTKLDLVGDNGAGYTIPLGNSGFYNRSRQDIRSDLKDLFDGDYETQATVNDRRQNFNNSALDQYQIRHSVTTGVGIEYKIAKRASLSLEAKYTWTGDDYLDGWYLLGGNNAVSTITPQSDNLFVTNLGINFNIGSTAKRVAPLWWLNPLGHVYAEISNPTNMKFPKPILDDTDGDGVTDQFDIEPNTPAGAPVDTHGKVRDTDGDGVPDYLDKELITPTICQPVDADGVGTCPPPPCCDSLSKMDNGKGSCGIGSLPSIQFASGTKLSKSATTILASVAEQIKANPACKICVVGHGNANKRAQQLSWARTEAVIKYLVEKLGISRDRFGFKYGEEGDANTVDLQDATGQEGPNMVPAPHPQYRK